jgi:hypothetical protein
MNLKHVGAFPVERDHDEEVGCGLDGRLVPTRTRFAGHETEGRGNPSHLADPSRGPKPPASVFSLPVSMVEAPALAPLMPAVGLEALKAPGIVTTVALQ